VRILVVEDELILGEALATALRAEFGDCVDLARDGAAAQDAASQQRYDLVVLDWSLPSVTGVELLGRWRARAEVGRVLMLSAWDRDRERQLALAAGADRYLTKPVRLQDLRCECRQLLSASASPLLTRAFERGA
jgi:DNA-binding response OmpR family regulator